jgi:hypothetical protein
MSAKLQAVGSMNYDDTVGRNSEKFSTSNPAGWAMIFWAAAVLIILFLFFTL